VTTTSKQKKTDTIYILAGMTRVNVTVNNYDPMVAYTPAGAWHAPDPSAIQSERSARRVVPSPSGQADV
jgi:hypothetical protein